MHCSLLATPLDRRSIRPVASGYGEAWGIGAWGLAPEPRQPTPLRPRLMLGRRSGRTNLYSMTSRSVTRSCDLARPSPGCVPTC